MEETKQLTDNEIIAAFMGFDVYDYELFGNMTRVYSPKTNDSVLRALTMHNINQLKYHQSWDWLMPVVEKIEKLYHEAFPKDFIQKLLAKEPTIDHHYMDVIAAPLATPINEAYESVVAFIKWYSNQPQKA